MVFSRHLFPALRAELKNQKILILMGSRRVGKTTLLRMLEAEEKRKKKKTVFLDLDRELQLIHLASLEDFLSFLKTENIDPEEPATIFIDEFQHAQKSVKIFKNIADHFSKLKIVASGSSSLDIKTLLPESLAGRKRVYHIYPLTFDELLHFQGLDDLREKKKRMKTVIKPNPETVNALRQKYEEYLLYGGYPEVVLKKTHEEKIRELEDIYEAYIQKDIRGFLQISNVQAYNQLIRVLAFSTGQILNISSIAREIGLDGRTTLKYLQLLEDTFIVTRLPSFHLFQKRKDLIKAPKLLFIDTGIRNFSLGNFVKPLERRTDRGALLETAVIAEALKYKGVLGRLQYWRTKSGLEIDLIITKGEHIRPIEIKYSKRLISSDLRALESFQKIFHTRNSMVLSLDP